jgi:hypothetical protein
MFFPVEIWTRSKSNYSQLMNAHPWGCPVYVLDPRLQYGFKILHWEPCSRRGIFMGISPLYARRVGLILNPNSNLLSPQFNCVYDDYFETIHSHHDQPLPIWEELVINQRFRNDLEDDDIQDNWETIPVEPKQSQPIPTPTNVDEIRRGDAMPPPKKLHLTRWRQPPTEG